MSRRMDREGVHRMEPQAIRNQRHQAEKIRRGLDKTWWVRFDVAEGWQALNAAGVYRYRQMAWRHIENPSRRAEEFRLAKLLLADSRRCDRPRLP